MDFFLEKSDLNSDSLLLKELNKGNQLAFDQLFYKYGNRLFGFALSYLRNDADAEEVVQDVFTKIWVKHKEINTEQSFKSYLFTIAYNIIRRKFLNNAKEKYFKHELIESSLIEDHNTVDKVDYQSCIDLLDQLIDQLPTKRREIFILRKKEHLPVKEIAEKLNISPKTVENQLTEALKFLKSEFAKENLGTLIFFYVFLSSDI